MERLFSNLEAAMLMLHGGEPGAREAVALRRRVAEIDDDDPEVLVHEYGLSADDGGMSAEIVDQAERAVGGRWYQAHVAPSEDEEIVDDDMLAEDDDT